MARCAACFGWLLVGLGSGQLNAAEPDNREPVEAPPSAELLLYLAEFGDDSGQVDDPIAVERVMRAANADPAGKEPAAEATETMEFTQEEPEQ